MLTIIRAATALALCMVLPGCGSIGVTHGPISQELLTKLDSQSISRAGLMRQLVRGEMVVSLSPPQRSQVIVPFWMESGTPHIKASINGKRGIPMVFDTGAVKTLIHATVATEQKVKMISADDVTVSMRGVIGNEEGRIGILEPLEIGGWQLFGYPVVVRVQENLIRSAFGTTSAWKSNLLGFDIAARLATYLTVDYKAQVVEYGFHRAYQPRLGKRVFSGPFLIEKGAPFITLKAGKTSWKALVDTGSFNGIEISEQIAAKLRVGPGKPVTGLFLLSVGGATTSTAAGLRTVVIPEIEMLGQKFTMAQADVSPGIPRIGSFLLKDYRVTFDFRRKKLWLEW